MRKKYFSRFIDDSGARRIISKLDVELLEIGYATASDHWWNKDFSADMYFRLYYTVNGESDLRFSHELFHLIPGNLYIIPANVPFKYEPSEPLSHYWLHFFSSMLEKLPFFHYPMTVKVKNPKFVEELWEKIIALSLHQGNTESLLEMDILLRSLLLPLLSKIPMDDSADIIADMDKFTKVLDYIDNNLRNPLPISLLAEMSMMTQNQFSASFRRSFGIPPKQYICRRRIDRSKALLLRGELTTAQIAREVGYEDEFYFYRLFRKYAGMTPSTYKQNNDPCTW